MMRTRAGATLLLYALAAHVVGQSASAQMGVHPMPTPKQWPTNAWLEATPESQGLSSNDLADALEFAAANHINIHSLTVVRNGFIVLDAYFYPFTREMRHDIASNTKSIVSLLVGLAVAEGRISGLAQPVVDLLPTNATRGLSERKAHIRVGDLLSMQSGLDCGFARGEPELREMNKRPDGVAYALSLNMVADPGTRFGYCSPNYHVLSAALVTASRVSVFEYARAHLFDPLGIKDTYWPADRMGITHGWGDLQLHPHDMAKIGLLMLQRGRWDEQQLLPQTWIDSSTTLRAHVNENEDYGLGWWLSRRMALFEANGRGGQRITVVPAKNMVAVMTGGGFEPGDVGRYLLAAVRADTALPKDANAQARLAAALDAITAGPQAHTVSHPAIEKDVARRTYTLDDNPLGIRTFAIEFSDSATATLRLRLTSGTVVVQPMGLDGVYRVISSENGAAAAGRGEWLPDGRFRAEFNQLARINRYSFDVEFRGDRVLIVASEPTELGTVNLHGK